MDVNVDPEDLYRRAFELASHGHSDAAAGLLQSAYLAWKAEGSPRRVDALREWGLALAGHGDFEAGILKVLEALAINPHDDRSYGACNDLARLLVGANLWDEAQRCWAEAVALGENAESKKRAIALRRWGDALLERNDHAGAHQKFRAALSVDPENERLYDAYNRLAEALVQADRPAEAEQCWAEAAALGNEAQARQRAVALRRWGEALLARQDYASAREKLRAALIADPDSEVSHAAYAGLARALVEAELSEQADQCWTDAVALAEKSREHRAEALRGWGQTLLARKDYAGAHQRFREALIIDPDNVWSFHAYDDLARALVAANRSEEAGRCWAEAIALGGQAPPQHRADALRRWGEMLLARKDHAGARQKLREALTADLENERSYAAYNALARALIEANHFAEAERCWGEAVALGEQARSKQRAKALRAWSNALFENHRADEALGKRLLAFEIDQDYQSTEWFSRFARAQAQKGRFDEAARAISKAAALLRDADGSRRVSALLLWAFALRSIHVLDDAAALFREGLTVAPGDPELYRGLGLVLADQGEFENALRHYDRSVALHREQGGTGSRYALIEAALALRDLDRFDEAVDMARQATQVEPNDAWMHFEYANVLADSDRLDDALAALNKAFQRESDYSGGYLDPYLRHNRAHYLFTIGRYKEGWAEWRNARDAYESALRRSPVSDSSEEKAVVLANFGNLLANVLGEYVTAEKHLKMSIDLQAYSASAWRTLVSAYQKWADSDCPPPDLQLRLSRAVQQATVLSERQLRIGHAFPVLLALADMHLEIEDWIAAESCLARASAVCPDSRRKRSEIDARRGLLEFRSERFAAAVEHLRRAAKVQFGNLELRANLGKALLRAKRLLEARDEFDSILKSAPNNIDALIGAGRVCIELAEGGETEYYEQAELRLSEALRCGRDAETGSIRLLGGRLDEVYYLRGYVRSKRWEYEEAPVAFVTLYLAKQDFASPIYARRNNTC